MSVMSCRVLRSKKVLPDGSIASVKKSRKAILHSYDELSNTPKESENEDALEKKFKKKRIRRTNNSFLIDDSCKREKIQNGRYNTESSNSKPKSSRKKDCSLVFDSSSDYDSVFEDEEVSSRKTRKTKKKFKLPTFQLDDFQQYNRKMQKLRQESDTNNSKSSKECSNTSNVVHKNEKIKQNRMENNTSKQKDSASLIPTDVKIKNEGNTNFESVYFTPSPMEKNQLPNSTKLTKCENNSDSKTETNIGARKSCSRNSGTPNGFVYESSTSEESDSKKEHQVISEAIHKRINNSNVLVSTNGYFCSETITTPLKPSFSDDSSDALNLNNSHLSSFKQNTHVQDVSNHVENNSDSEIEFDCCPKDSVQISSDFPMMIQNASVEESNKKEENAANNSKKILVQTKINSRTDTKNPNISMSVSTVNCGDIYLDNTENSMSKQNEDVAESFGKRARKRWTILEGNEARKSFNAQMNILRRSLLISRTNQNSPNNKDVKSRRSLRKRWSDELRKSVSALDISKNSKHDVDLKIDSHSDDKLENTSGGNRFSTNSRRSRFSSSSSIDRSTTEFTKTTPHVSIDNLSKSNINRSRRRTFEIQKDVNDAPLLILESSKISNGRDYKDPVMLKRRDTYELEESVADYKDPVMNKRRETYELEESVADYKDPVMNKSETYELEESVTGMNILRTLSDSTFTDIGVDVLPRENSVDFSTSKKVNFENITRRKLLDKPTKELEVANGHNSLINKSSKRVCFKNSKSKKRSMSLDKPFSPTTFTSSTPKCVFQSSSAQKSINTGKHLPLSRRRSKSADQGNTRITGIRMPNFAKIHQKAREKMENIVQLTERKAERAKLLLSGQKPNDSRDVLNSDNNARDVKRSHKQLPFDSSKPSTSKGFLRVYQGKKEQLKVASTKIPVFNEIKSELPKDIGLKVAVPEKHKNAEKTRPPKAISLKKVTQFGFKIRSDSCSANKLDQIKALAAKTKLQQDNRAEQRSILKGVRSNKRFELLMKMRKK